MPETLKICNCFASRQAARVISKLYESHLASASITSTQFSILAMLEYRRTATMKDMSSALAMERTSIIRALQPMERGGLIQVDQGAFRKHHIALTESGREKLAQAIPAWMRAQQEFEDRFGRDFAETMRNVLLAVKLSHP
jgi:DNA-binding MarR family transcriptional regulator